MKLVRFCREGDALQRGWGVAYVYELGAYTAPIPLNFMIGGWHWFYWRVLVRGFRLRTGRNALRDAYRRGYEDGLMTRVEMADEEDEKANYSS
jgi:hypothetical protein